MVLFVPKDVILAARQSRYHSEIHSEAGRVYHHILLADIFGYLVLQFLMQIERSVEKRRAGTSGAILACCFYGGFLYPRVVDQTGIAVGAEHQHLASVDGDLGILLARNSPEIRIHPGRFSFLGLNVLGKFGL